LYTSFSGTDIVATLAFPGKAPVVFGELQTITYSIHRDKFPVRTLGRINPKGFAFGGRTIAGSLIFTVFDRHAIISAFGSPFSVTDELPPFDVTINLKNEYGDASVIRITGITIIDEGQVMSIEDILTENTMSYMATDIVLMENKTTK
jgi:hypothetical protein